MRRFCCDAPAALEVLHSCSAPHRLTLTHQGWRGKGHSTTTCLTFIAKAVGYAAEQAHHRVAAAEHHAHKDHENEHLQGIAGDDAIPATRGSFFSDCLAQPTAAASEQGTVQNCAREHSPQPHPKSCFLNPLKLPRLCKRRLSTPQVFRCHRSANSKDCMPYLVSIIHRKSIRLGGMEKLMLIAVAIPFVASRPYSGTFTRFTCGTRVELRMREAGFENVRQLDTRWRRANSKAAHLEELDEGEDS